MIKELTKLANHLDSKGLAKEADAIDSIIRKAAGMFDENDTKPLGRRRRTKREHGIFKDQIPPESQTSETIITPKVRSIFDTYKTSSESNKLRILAQALLLEGLSTFAKIKDAIIQTDPPLNEQGIDAFANQIIKEQNPEMIYESVT